MALVLAVSVAGLASAAAPSQSSSFVIGHSSFPGPAAPASAPWPGHDLFTNGAIPRLHLDIRPADIARLRQQPREFVPVTLTEAHAVYPNVAVHLKGSLGSFRPIDDKPALTLDFSLLQPDRKFHGLRRIHLNNSVEDPSCANEKLGSEWFQAAGIPAARVTRALVTLNERPLGLYVLIEGFTEDFLACHFKQIGGDLFEPDTGHDVDARLKRLSIPAPTQGHAALDALAAAAAEPDPARRWQRLGDTLDLDRFLTFMALEVMICHRDGYCLARNNFRVYHDLDSGKVLFLPHGMDQLLGRPDFPWQPAMAGLVARAVMDTPQGRLAYSARFRSLFADFFKPLPLTNRVEQLTREWRAVLDPKDFASVSEAAALVKDRIVQRRLDLQAQLNRPPPKPLEFTNGVAHLENWNPADVPAGARLERAQAPGGVAALRIVAGPRTSTSWRAKALLEPGRYRFEGRAKVTKVKPLPFGIHEGAGLRIGGGVRQQGSLIGSSSWQLLAVEFEVEPAPRQVEFICELRASAGEAWFDLPSLRIIKLP
jgi:hypothetical protein